MENLQCSVDKVLYRNGDNGYAVARVYTPSGDKVTIVGFMPSLCDGVGVSCAGSWVNSPRFGRQFSVESYTVRMPVTAEGIERYLSSGAIKGVGPGTARLIVKTFGLDTIRILDGDPDRLREVRGIGAAKIDRIRRGWEDQRGVKSVMLFLQSHGVTAGLANKIYARYGPASVKTVRDNPYLLADDLWGVGFQTADRLASGLGYGKSDIRRVKAGVTYTLGELAKDGHAFARRDQLVARCAGLLDCDPGTVPECVDIMAFEGSVVIDDETGDVYLPMYYHSERGLSRRLLSLLAHGGAGTSGPDPDFDAITRTTKVEYDDIQKSAIQTAMRSKVMVLTGGPGTGKTTTVQGIIEALRSSGERVALAAPTGRAAKRMSEATGMPAKTIHRILEYKPGGGFARDKDNPISGDALIVDECSMVDLPLMNSLVKAIPPGMRLVMVGDVDQLPSVGVGCVLRDIIESGAFPVVRLTRIFRQAQRSRIVMNAHAINAGRTPDMSNGKDTDFFFVECEDRDSLAGTVTSLVAGRLPGCYGVSPRDIQVLTPMRRGPAGTDALNAALQAALNPDGAGVAYRGTVFRAGDRVMQIRNNYDKDAFNGDLGYIVSADSDEDTLTVDFDGRLVRYEYQELDELTLAYATTIHKSQGSEYPIVVMPVHTTHYIMLQRNLLYTGITRAKRICVLVGSKRAVTMAVRARASLTRNTRLRQRIQNECNNQKQN